MRCHSAHEVAARVLALTHDRRPLVAAEHLAQDLRLALARAQAALDLSDGVLEPVPFGRSASTGRSRGRGARRTCAPASTRSRASRLSMISYGFSVPPMTRTSDAEPQVAGEERRGLRVEHDVMIRRMSRRQRSTGAATDRTASVRRRSAFGPAPREVAIELHLLALAQLALGVLGHPHRIPRRECRRIARMILVPVGHDDAAGTQPRPGRARDRRARGGNRCRSSTPRTRYALTS